MLRARARNDLDGERLTVLSASGHCTGRKPDSRWRHPSQPAAATTTLQLHHNNVESDAKGVAFIAVRRLPVCKKDRNCVLVCSHGSGTGRSAPRCVMANRPAGPSTCPGRSWWQHARREGKSTRAREECVRVPVRRFGRQYARLRCVPLRMPSRTMSSSCGVSEVGWPPKPENNGGRGQRAAG